MNVSDLARLSIMESFSPQELAMLASVFQIQEVGPHRHLFHKGEPAYSCLLVLRGEVTVELETPAERLDVARFGTGELIGEVAMLDGGHRSAACVAGPTGARLARLAKADFDRIFHAANPLAYKLTQIIVGRLTRNVRAMIHQLIEKADPG